MQRHGFESADAFEAALNRVLLYSPRDPCFFTWVRAIMLRSCNRRNARESALIWDDLVILNDDGWMYPSWHPGMRDEMIPALIHLYNTIDDGVDWEMLKDVVDL